MSRPFDSLWLVSLCRPGAYRIAGLTLSLLTLASIAAAPAGAQIVISGPTPDYLDSEYSVEGDVEKQFGADVSGGDHFDRLRFTTGFSAGGPVSKNLRISLAVRYGNSSYDFKDNPTRWGDIHNVDIAPAASLVLNESFHIVAIVPMRWNAESNSDENALTAGIIGALRFRFSESFAVLGGVGVQSELADDMSVFPVIALQWRMSDTLMLQTLGGPYAGGGAEIVWGPANSIQFKLSAEYEKRRFRLSSRGSVANGVGQYAAVPIKAGFRLNLARTAQLEVSGGIAVSGELRIDESGSRTLQTKDFDTAGLVGGALRFRF